MAQADDSQTGSEDDYKTKIENLFGKEIFQAFLKEDITDESAIADLVARNADAPIFEKLGLTYGKAVKLKQEFRHLVTKDDRQLMPMRTSPASSKPSMADVSTFSPEMKQLYLTKRKKIGVRATEKWRNSSPTFNSPEMKVQLKEFSKEIEPECGIPEINFGEDGISKHIQAFFSEQRRYKKRIKQENQSDEEPATKCIKSLKLKNKSVKVDSDEPSSIDKKTQQQKDAKNSRASTWGQEEMDDDYDSSGSSTGSTVLVAVSSEDDSPTNSQTQYDKDKLNNHSSRLLLKAVFGNIPERENAVKLLKHTFNVHQKLITPLSPSQINGVLAKKLIKNGYISINKGVTLDHNSKLKMGDVVVHKRISL